MPEEVGRLRQAGQGVMNRAGQAGAYAAAGYANVTSTGVGRAFMRGMGEGVGLGFAPKPITPSWIGEAGKVSGVLDFTAKSESGAAKKAFLSAAPKRYSFQGPLGLLEYGATARAEKAAWGAMSPSMQSKVGGKIGETAVKNIGKVKFGAGAALGTAMRALGPVMVAHSMYTGYQEEGVWGAVKSGAEELAIWGAFEAGMYMLGGPVVMGAAAVGAAGVGFYAYGEAAQEHRKKMKGIEMGGQVFDPYGMNATTRQRSLQALHNSHINGRMALGSEAVLMHRG